MSITFFIAAEVEKGVFIVSDNGSQAVIAGA
jgi:hypothetical protein